MHLEEPDDKLLDDEKMLLPLQHADDADHLVQLAILMLNK